MSDLDRKYRQAEEQLDKLLRETTSHTKKTKIKAVYETCRKIIESGATPSISLLVKHLVQNGFSISTQTLYNKQSGNNPYRQIFDLWLEISQIKSYSKNIKIKPSGYSEEILNDADLKSIADPVLRYRISLMFGELMALKKQNDMLRDIREMPPITALVDDTHNDKHVTEEPDSYDLDIISRLVSNGVGLGWDDTGRLIAVSPIRSGTVLSAEGLREALTKVLNKLQ